MGSWVMAVSGLVVALYTVPLGIQRLSQGWASRGVGWEYLSTGVGCGFIAASGAISLWWTSDRRYRLYQIWRGAADKPLASGTLRSRVDFYLRRAGIDFHALPKSRRRKWITLIVAAFSLASFCIGLVGLVWLFFSDMQVVRLNRALLDAINRGDTTVVRELLDKGAESGAMSILDRPSSFLAAALLHRPWVWEDMAVLRQHLPSAPRCCLCATFLALAASCTLARVCTRLSRRPSAAPMRVPELKTAPHALMRLHPSLTRPPAAAWPCCCRLARLGVVPGGTGRATG
jgi:hypothetical protein